MSEIHVTAHMKIYEGKIDRFEMLAKQFTEIARSKDERTLQYDWFLNDDRTECIMHERYMDSDAVLEHISNLGEELMGELREMGDLSPLVICGTPSKELIQAFEGLDYQAYHYFEGL